MSSSEGRYEIEAAKARLAAAKAQRTSADKLMSCAKEVTNNAKATLERAQQSMDTAKKNQEMVQSQLDKAREEVKAAEKCLAESEKRHEVIDIDDIDDDTPQKKEDSSNKKRKVSMSPREQGNNDEVVVLSDSPPRRSNNNNSSGGNTASSIRRQIQQERVRQYGTQSGRTAGSNNRITVSGCGNSVVNGTYTKTGTLCEGSPTYSKQGNYNGNSEVIVIFCRKSGTSRNKHWFIGISGKPVFFYTSIRAVGGGPNAGSTDLLPLNAVGWMTKDKGVHPRPTLTQR